ncbi:MAG TPA: hypothetical protein VKR60_02555 [Candidatus Sulfotelmatobacter sp.]|nr:hypothetical protein [Candidatus Sulfotelmatobacter sp.]
MNCVDLRRSLAGAEEFNIAEWTEERSHLKTCAACSALVAELDLIAVSASALRAGEEPSPRVWNSIEIALREEGLIRPQTSQPLVSKPAGVPSRVASARGLSSFAAGWGWRGWLVPAAAALLIAVGFFVNQRSLVHQLSEHIAPLARTTSATETMAGMNVADLNPAGLNDDDLLQEIQNQTPEIRAQYVDNLRRANEYIRDAQTIVNSNPNDEESRRSLLEAYQQKAMLFEMAMDRSLP